jgi:hypothetical protein
MPETEILNGVRWTPSPEERVYRPPAEPEQFRPPSVTAPAINSNGTTVEKAAAAIVHANDSFAKHVTRTDEHRHHYTPEGYKAQIAAFAETAAARSVDGAVNSVRERRDQLAAQVDKIYRGLTPLGDAAQEARNDRYWNQTLRILDNIKELSRVDAVAKDLLANADRAQLGVLLQELQPYIQARLERIEDPRVKKQFLNGYSESVDAAVCRIVPE